MLDGSRPDIRENVRGGGKMFRGGATVISPSRQRVKIKNNLIDNFCMIMSTFYTFLSSLYNCLLKFISLILLSGEVRKFLGEALKISGPTCLHYRGLDKFLYYMCICTLFTLIVFHFL